MATYADLKADMESEAIRPNLTAQIPRFIRQATQRINREVRVSEMSRRARAFGNGTRYLASPDLFLEMRRMWNVVDGATTPVPAYSDRRATRNAMVQVAPQALLPTVGNNGGQVRLPYYFAVHRGEPPEIEFDSILADDREVEMIYLAAYAEFVDDTDTNWLLDNNYDLYFEGALYYLYKFDRDNDEASSRAAGYKAALAELNTAEGRQEYTQPIFATANHNVV